MAGSPTILVVDDDGAVIQTMHRVLSRMGYRVLAASSVSEALRHLDGARPDVALLDLHLPDGTGQELAESIQRRRPGCPLILMTGAELSADGRQALAARFRLILSKPLNLDELRQAIEDTLHAEPAQRTASRLAPGRSESAPPVVVVGTKNGSNPMMQVLKVTAGVLIAVAIVGAFGVFVLGIPLTGKARADAAEPKQKPRQPTPAIELVADKEYTLMLPEAVRRSLGIRRGDRDYVAAVKAPTQLRPLVLPGSTALDPARIMRVRARFAPAEVVRIGEFKEAVEPPGSVKAPPRELRPGDKVARGQELGTFYSVDVGNKKNDLFEAIVQLRLDQIILDRAEKAGGALPEIYLWTARRNVDTDRSTVRRARNMLKVWDIPEDDIKAVEKEAYDLKLTAGKREGYEESDWAKQHDHWARVVLRAPDAGVIIERNVTRGELVVDNTINLFTLARVDEIAVVANCPEDDLPELYRYRAEARKKGDRMRWTVRTVGARKGTEVEGTIDEIGWLIDPNQHTAVIKGYIRNPKNAEGEEMIRAGQFVTTTIQLSPPDDVVEIPVEALVEDGKQSVVFVQTDPVNHHYQMRRVVVTNRFDRTVFVSSKELPEKEQLTGEEKEEGLLPRKPLTVKEKILTTGVLELKAALQDMETKLRIERAKQARGESGN
jgi:cobalt-zinc-cadmium efflux system membrane fusion protein